MASLTAEPHKPGAAQLNASPCYQAADHPAARQVHVHGTEVVEGVFRSEDKQARAEAQADQDQENVSEQCWGPG